MNGKIVKEVFFGAIGGAAGTVVIGASMKLLSRLESNRDKGIERALQKEPPTEKLARRAAQTGLGVDLSKEKKRQLGSAVHWGYGITWGAIYALMRNRIPLTSKVAGLPFGVAFGLFGSALLLPAFKLSPPAKEFPASTHVRGLLAHYAYAATVEGVCAGMEAVDQAIARKTGRRTKAELRAA